MHCELMMTKGHATGNAFLVYADPAASNDLSPSQVRALCSRRTGIGADGVLRAVRADSLNWDPGNSAGAQWLMDHRNADGSVGIMCGNGIRVLARFLVDAGLATPGVMRIGTRGGVKTVNVPDVGPISVGMGIARFLQSHATTGVTMAGRRYDATAVEMPNPHAVVQTRLADLPTRLSAADFDPRVFPGRANLSFVEVLDPEAPSVRMRVIERGSGETLSCGTGACAVAAVMGPVLGVRDGQPLQVHVDGGRLEVARAASGELQLVGPATLVAQLNVVVPQGVA